ncbi:MAG: hypothetical protein ACTS4U_00605 [Candidatus Hodgkinia cicadicola]
MKFITSARESEGFGFARRFRGFGDVLRLLTVWRCCRANGGNVDWNVRGRKLVEARAELLNVNVVLP